MMEALIAGALGLTLISTMYGAMSLYFRTYEREGEGMERSRRVQTILGKVRRDFIHAKLQPLMPRDLEEPFPVPLADLGYDRTPENFLEEPRYSLIFYNAFHDEQSERPYRSEMYAYKQVYSYAPDLSAGPDGYTITDVDGEWVGPRPQHTLAANTIPKSDPRPWAFRIGHPEKGDERIFFCVRSVDGLTIYAHHPRSRGKIPAGSFLRWTARSGIVDLGGPQFTIDHLIPVREWVYIDPRSLVPEKLFPLKEMLRIEIRYLETTRVSKQRVGNPEYSAHSLITWGN